MNGVYLLELLVALEVALPPGNGHHSICRTQYGSDAEGWMDRLTLVIRIPDGYQALFLGMTDLGRPIGELVAEVVELVRNRDASSQTLPASIV